MFNRRSLIAGLGALCTVPFLPKLSQGKEFYDGKEVIRIEIKSREFYYRRYVRGIAFARSVKMTEFRKDVTPSKLIEQDFLTNFHDDVKYIFIISHGEYAHMFGSETDDVRIVENRGFQKKRLVFPRKEILKNV